MTFASPVLSYEHHTAGLKPSGAAVTKNKGLMHAKETHAGAKPFPGCFFSLCTTVCLLAAAADGAVRTWDGGGANGFWATPANWVGDIAPVSGDDLVFPPGAATLSNTNNFAAGFLFNSITISGGSYSLYGTNVLLNAGLNATNTTVPNFFFIPITLNSNQSITTGNSGVNLYLYGAINGNGKNLTFDGAGLALVNSAISGVGGLIKTGPGSADLYASNAFDGPVQILQGFSSIYDAHALGSTNANTTIASGTTLFLANSISLAEPLVLSGTLGSTGGSNTVTGPILLSVSNATVRTLPGGPLTLAGTISGTGGFSKIASDVLRLTANNTYSGTTALSAGTLLVNGNQPASPIVFGGGTLGGTGTVGTITPSGPFGRLLAPGVSPGILTCSNLTLDVLSAFAVEVNGTTPGTGYDQLEVHGTVSLGNALLSISNTIGVVAGQSFTIINNDGADPVAGTFSGLPEGAVLTTVGANQLRITYAGGTGNDVVLFVMTLAGSGGVAV